MRTRIICGISPGPSGTGRVLEFVEQEILRRGLSVSSVYGPLGFASNKQIFAQNSTSKFILILLTKIFRKLFFRWQVGRIACSTKPEHLILFHQQSIGYDLVEQLIQNANKKITLFLLDGNSFCQRSFNFIPGSQKPCLACLGGHFAEAGKHKCVPVPFAQNMDPEKFMQVLFDVAKSGKIRLLTQNRLQSELMHKHFGNTANIVLAGIWGNDWPEQVCEQGASKLASDATQFDFVFHAWTEAAKGFEWAFNLAKAMPQRTFLFPFLAQNGQSLPNASFTPMTWSAGLKQACMDANIVLCPSQWTAVSEGALIKSLAIAKTVGVTDIQNAFSQELPASAILRLPADIAKAAELAEARLSSGWAADRDELKKWFNSYIRQKNDFIDILFEPSKRI